MQGALPDGAKISDVITDDAITLLAAKLKTPLQIGRYLVRAFEAGFGMGGKPVDARLWRRLCPAGLMTSILS